jgi:thymidine kinase
MFSAKTRTMLEEIKKYTLAKKKVLLIKHSFDTRYTTGEEIITHDGQKNDTNPYSTVVITSKLKDVHPSEMIIGVDEGQFFDDIVEVCDQWANEGRVIFIAALDGTFAREPFPNIAKLIAKAEHVTKLNGICMQCGNFLAAFSQRLTESKEIVDVGGVDKYAVVCRKCHKTM